MERLSKKNIYYDVAHNYDGVKALIKTAEKVHPEKKIVGLFCIKAEKNIDLICQLLKKYFTKIIICQDKEKYLLSIKKLSEIFKREKIKFSEAKSVKEGIKILKSKNMEGCVRLIFGSHYIAKEVYSEF
jgi:Folylpolyglutamate synthase